MNSPEQTPEIMRITHHPIANLNNPTNTKITLFVQGEVDPSTAPEFNDEIRGALNNAETVDIDLDGIHFFSAAGINGLIEACAIAQRQNRTISIKNPSLIVQRLMAMTGVEQALPVEYDQ